MSTQEPAPPSPKKPLISYYYIVYYSIINWHNPCEKDDKENSPDRAAPTFWPEKEDANITHLMAKRPELTGIGIPEMIFKAKKATFNFYFVPTPSIFFRMLL